MGKKVLRCEECIYDRACPYLSNVHKDPVATKTAHEKIRVQTRGVSEIMLGGGNLGSASNIYRIAQHLENM